MINSWIEINTQNLMYNLRQFRQVLSPTTKLLAVVKSNAYGHDMVLVAKAIQKQTDWLGVVNLEEALILRKAGIHKPILVLSFYFNQLELAIKNNISLVVYDLKQVQKINLVAKKIKKIAKVHLKLDTGTSRLGVGETKGLKLIREIICPPKPWRRREKLKNIEIEGIFSHFAAAEENQKYTDFQLKRFNSFITKLERQRIKIPFKHFACSAAALVRPDSHFNLIRLGISLYGLWPSKLAKRLTLKKYPWFNLRPVLTWKTRVIAVKYLPAGTPVGYGCTYKTRRKIQLVTLPVGYWDGYDRHLSNKGEVLIRGVRCPVVGRVCMNLIMVDATKVSKVKVGEGVVLLGRQGRQEISAEELAEKIGTINYEVVTRINPELPRKIK
jgi:alanine racemase